MSGSALRAWWLPEDPADLPVQQAPRTLAEMATDVFRSQDLLCGESATDKERRRSAQQWHLEVQDTAENLAFLGRPVGGAIQRHLQFCAYEDMVEERDRQRRRAKEREQHEARVAELEQQVDAERQELAGAHARAERFGRVLTQAVEGWTAERARSEQGAGFRDGGYRRTSYR